MARQLPWTGEHVCAWCRHPDAAGYVGLTKLPQPETVMQHAMSACGICFFYGIANKLQTPPWGVTANICVRARTNNSVWCVQLPCPCQRFDGPLFVVNTRLAAHEKFHYSIHNSIVVQLGCQLCPQVGGPGNCRSSLLHQGAA